MAEDKKYWTGFLDDVDSPQDAAKQQSDAAGAAKSGKWAGFLDDVESPSPASGPAGAEPAQYSNEPGFVPGIKRAAALGVNALYTGVNHILGAAGDVEALGNEYLPSFLTRPINSWGTGKTAPANQLFPTSETVSDYTDAGLERRPDLKPQNWKERYGTALAEAAPNALTLGAGGGMGMLRAATVAGAGALGAEGAKDLFPGNKWAPIVGGVVSTLLAGWGTGAVKSALENSANKKELAAAHSAYNDAVEAARQGRNTSAVDVANLKSTSTAILNRTKDTAAESVELANSQAQDNFSSAAKSWGTSTSPQEAGTRLQDAARTWMTKTFPEKIAALKAPLDAAIPAETPVELSNFNGTLNSINKTAGSLQPLVDVLTKAMPRQLAKASGAMEEAEGLLAAAGPTWAEARTLRSTLGDAMKDPELVSKIGESNLKALYKSATADLTSTAKSVGAEDIWKAFNEGSTKLYNFADNTLSKVISSTNPTQESIKPEDVATLLLSGAKKGGTDLKALHDELPGAVGELSSAQLHQGAKAWDGLSKEAKAVLVPDSAQRAGLERSFKNTETATANAREVVRDANREHAAAMQAAQSDAKAGNFEQSTAIVAARNRKLAAAAKVNKENSIEGIQSTLHGMKKSAVGVLGANMLGPMLNAVPGAGAAMQFGAAIAPSVLNLGKNLLTNPQNMMIPASGVIAGENALAPDRARP